MNHLAELLIRCYQAALRLYPPAFRATFAEEMTATFAMHVRETAERGVLPLCWLLLCESAGVLSSACVERVRAHRRGLGWSGVGVGVLVLSVAGHGLEITLALFLGPLVLVLLPLLLMLLFRTTREAPQRQRKFGWWALVLSWGPLAFFGGLAVEKWDYANMNRAATETFWLVHVYDALLNVGLSRTQYGVLVAAASAVICTVRLVRNPAAASAPAMFAASNLAVGWIFILAQFLPLGLPASSATTQAQVASVRLHHATIDLTIALCLLVGLLIWQAGWRVAGRRSVLTR